MGVGYDRGDKDDDPDMRSLNDRIKMVKDKIQAVFMSMLKAEGIEKGDLAIELTRLK